VSWLCLAIIVTAAVLVRASLLEPGHIGNDVAQHVSTARLVLAGQGFVNDNLMYEEQFATGRLPSPQTVWPPGHPYAIAAATLVVGDAVRAAQLLSLAALALQAFAVHALLLQAGVARLRALVAGGVTAALATPSFNALTGATEPLFTLATLVSALAYVAATNRPARRDLPWLAGAFAALAYLFRYVGLFWLIALALMPFLGAGRGPSRRIAAEVVPLALPGAIAFSLVSARNHALSGTWAGGPAVYLGSTPAGIAKALVDQFAVAVRGYGSGQAGPLLDVLLVVGVTAIVVSLASRARRLAADATAVDGSAPGAGTARLIVLAATYVAGTFAALYLIARGRTEEFVLFRFFLPLLPFVVAGAAAAIDWLARTAPAPREGTVARALGLSLALVGLAAQVQAARSLVVGYRFDRAYDATVQAMAEPVDGHPLVEALVPIAGPDGPVLGADLQTFGALAGRPVISITPPHYSTRVWNETAVRELVQRYHVRAIVFFPRIQRWTERHRRLDPFLRALADGQTPAWLRRVHTSPELVLLAVQP
jgi:hypothetical protein